MRVASRATHTKKDNKVSNIAQIIRRFRLHANNRALNNYNNEQQTTNNARMILSVGLFALLCGLTLGAPTAFELHAYDPTPTAANVIDAGNGVTFQLLTPSLVRVTRGTPEHR